MLVHLVRHGEVENPSHLVYANLPGFRLSDVGVAQADAAATHLADHRVSRIVTSPLDRAVATATAIARRHHADVTTDKRLTEWRLGTRWAGVSWDDLQEEFPGELEAYLSHPSRLPFSPESLQQMAERVAGAIVEVAEQSPDGDVIFVSHQDPIHAAFRLLTGSGFENYHDNKPEHCSVSTLEPLNGTWAMVRQWAPVQ
ncbi:MAG: histidine phosphatase family protein [Actinomycetota bacterium]|nr:histidine phosphatase family protein [Actinomycetota bacterium]